MASVASRLIALHCSRSRAAVDRIDHREVEARAVDDSCARGAPSRGRRPRAPRRRARSARTIARVPRFEARTREATVSMVSTATPWSRSQSRRYGVRKRSRRHERPGRRPSGSPPRAHELIARARAASAAPRRASPSRAIRAARSGPRRSRAAPRPRARAPSDRRAARGRGAARAKSSVSSASESRSIPTPSSDRCAARTAATPSAKPRNSMPRSSLRSGRGCTRTVASTITPKRPRSRARAGSARDRSPRAAPRACGARRAASPRAAPPAGLRWRRSRRTAGPPSASRSSRRASSARTTAGSGRACSRARRAPPRARDRRCRPGRSRCGSPASRRSRRSRRVVSRASAPRLTRREARLDAAHHARAAAEGDDGEIRVGGDAQHRGDGAFVARDTRTASGSASSSPRRSRSRSGRLRPVACVTRSKALVRTPSSPHAARSRASRSGASLVGGSLIASSCDRLGRARDRAAEPPAELREQRGLARARHVHRLAESSPAVPAQRLARDHGRGSGARADDARRARAAPPRRGCGPRCSGASRRRGAPRAVGVARLDRGEELAVVVSSSAGGRGRRCSRAGRAGRRAW